MPAVSTAEERRERLKQLYERSRGCVDCQLHRTRTRVVFGSGNADAQLMFVGEAPGANEDREGLPFVGQAGRLLERMLGEIGRSRADVFIANVLMCRPPGNRDPLPREIEACSDYLREKIALIEPTMICTLGNFATKLLRDDQTSISRLHGREEVLVIGARAIRLYPLYHPAAALYHPSTLELLRADFQRIPEILALGPPPQPEPLEPIPEPLEPNVDAGGPADSLGALPGSGGPIPDQRGAIPEPRPETAVQLGLF
jgi:uracil-DNA glycosylase family 4